MASKKSKFDPKSTSYPELAIFVKNLNNRVLRLEGRIKELEEGRRWRILDRLWKKTFGSINMPD